METMYCEERLKHLCECGYPNSISLATAYQEYYPESYSNDSGYWPYVRFKSKIPFIPDVAFFSGDPICDRTKKEEFIFKAISSIGQKHIVSALQVHTETANIMTMYKKDKITPHQFGPETQITLPYRLVGQVGTKVRQCVNQNLQVEEMVFIGSEIETQSDPVYTDVSNSQLVCKKEKKKLNKDEYKCHEKNIIIIEPSSDDSINSLKEIIDEILKNSNYSYVAEYLRKIERFLTGKLPDGVRLFFQTDNLKRPGEISGFGYYQPIDDGANCHLYLISRKNKKDEKLLLRPGKKLVNKNDIEQMEKISDDWLTNKLTKREMGPPLLKPFKARHEPNRRLFVARDAEDNVVGFVDFDPVNWATIDGFIYNNMKGYYTNLIRTKKYTNNDQEILYKHVRFMIIAAAASRFTLEGCSHLNLGLTPFSPINYRTLIPGNQKLTTIDFITKSIGKNKLLNNITFRFANLMATKQNWSNKTFVPTHMVFSGGIFVQMYQLFAAFITTGALGFDVIPNFFNYLSTQLKKNRKESLVTK